MGALISALVSMAMSVGLSELSIRMSKKSYLNDAKKAYDQGLTSSQVMSAIEKILSKAASQSQKAYDDIISKINGLDVGRYYVQSAAGKNVINRISSQLENEKRAAEKRLESVNESSNSIRSSAQNYASMSDDYKTSDVGKKHYSQILQEAGSALGVDIGKYETPVAESGGGFPTRSEVKRELQKYNRKGGADSR